METTNSNAKIDFSKTLLPRLTPIMSAADSAKTKLEGYLTKTAVRPDISKELLSILFLSDQLVYLFNPLKMPGGYLAETKVSIGGSKEPLKLINGKGIDVTSWYAEKITNIKLAAVQTVEYWQMEPETLELTVDSPSSPEEYIIDGLESGLEQIKHYAIVLSK